MIDNKLNK